MPQHSIEHRPGAGHQRIAMMGAFQLTDFKATSLATRQQCRQRYTTAQAFAERNDVGAYTVVLFGEQGAATADTGLHFVEDQQNVYRGTAARHP